jgi:starch synthase
MRILFVTPELAPFSAMTPAADACAALPKALKGLGHEVTVLTPLWGFIDPEARGLARRLKKVSASVGGKEESFALYDTHTAAGLTLQFLGHDALFGGCRAVPLHEPEEDDAARFAAFCRAALSLIQSADEPYDAVHCHGWPTGLLPGLLREAGHEIGVVFTHHPMSDGVAPAAQGSFPIDATPRVAMPAGVAGPHAGGLAGRLSFTGAAIAAADRVTTVSPRYAETLSVDPDGLQPVLEAAGTSMTGILGGVDVALWNPASDPLLESRFDAMDPVAKHRNKMALQEELGLAGRDDVPLIAGFGPLTEEQGYATIARIAGQLFRNDLQLVLLDPTVGDVDLTTVLQEHSRRWPERFQVRSPVDEGAIHRLLAASDAVLVLEPHPASAWPMRAQRYGSLPIGPREASFADAVVDCDPALTTGNGFTYVGRDDTAVLSALQRVIAAYGRRKHFERVRLRAMRLDHSWDRAAYHYARLYRHARG